MDLENYITRQKEIINNVKKELEELKMSKAFDKKIIQEKLKANMNIINEIKSNIPKLLKSHEIIKQNENDEKEELISVIFNSIDENILYSIICNKNDEFSNIESLVFDKYPEYKYLNKDFIVNGNKINKQKNLEDNNIKNSDIITVIIK